MVGEGERDKMNTAIWQKQQQIYEEGLNDNLLHTDGDHRL